VPPFTVIIMADNADSAGVWKDALRRQGVESIYLRYGATTQNLSLPDYFDLVLIDSYLERANALVICG
jgi:hypothetical protein